MSSSSKAFAKQSERDNHMQVDLDSVEESMEDIPYCSELDFFQGDNDIAESSLLLYEELQLLAHFGAFDELCLDIVSPPFQACRDDLATLSRNEPQDSQPNQDNRPYSLPYASLEILRHCRSRVAVNGEKIDGAKGKRASPPASTVNLMIELAVRNFTPSNSETRQNLSDIRHHPQKTLYSSFSKGNSKDIQLLQNLLSCAAEVCNHQYDCASELLEELSKLNSSPTNVIQRLVYYFADSLRGKIELERRSLLEASPLEFIPSISATAAFLEKLPFNQVMQFAGIQAVIDHVSSSRKVHVVDLGLHGGLRHAILMQALASASECSLEHFKITAVATQSNVPFKEAGIRLQNLAKSLNLSFSFHVISLEDILDLHENVLTLDHEETVVVQAAHALRFIIPKLNQLENLMTVIRRINPHVMIITEVEANIDSPVFVNRFVEALSFFGAYFDYMESCLKNDLTQREIVESELFSPSIRHIIAAEEEKRKFRIVGINVWRDIFTKFGMAETELSKLSLNHADSVLKMFDCRDSCTFGLNGNSLIVGWKDIPIFSLSAWKFQEKGSE